MSTYNTRYYLDLLNHVTYKVDVLMIWTYI